ncbi:MAG: electron transport complex subunit RsxB [Pseudomonadales bacterium]
MIDWLPGILLMTGLAGLAALLLLTARRRFPPETDAIVQHINQVLPQTQCAQCGYPGCLPYAEAVAAGAAINLCPPGGDETVTVLAALLGREPEPLSDPAAPVVAVIREADCIGCTLCLPACPVDAIIGSAQTMHTVMASECTGCELCLDPCPVDCIDLVPAPATEPVPAFPDFEMNCINCGFCETACPRDLQPQQLFHERERSAALEQLDLSACIECYKCDRVCPSELPLTLTFKAARIRGQQERLAAAVSQRYQDRFEAHQQRLASATSKVRKRPSSDDKSALLAKLGGNA